MSESKLIDSLSTDSGREERSNWYVIKKAFTVAKYQFKFIFTYRLHIILMLASILFDVGIYFFLGILVDTGLLADQGYGDSYLLFALLGVAISRYLWSSMARISHQTHHAYIDGYFESTTGTRAGVYSWMLGLAVYGFSWGTIWLLATLLIGMVAVLPMVFTALTFLETILAILLGVFIHTGIGLIIAGVSIVHKRVDPIVFILTSLFSLFGGVIYPYSVLKMEPILFTISRFIPFTHTLEIARLALGGGAEFTREILTHFAYLVPYLIFIPIGLKSVDYYYDKARKKEGIQSY